MQDKKNLLFVIGDAWFNPNGISNMSKLLIDYLEKASEYNIKILVQGKDGNKAKKIYPINMDSKISILFETHTILSLVYWADIIHYQSTSKVQILVNKIANLLKKRQIVTFHGTDIWYANSKDKYMLNLLTSVSNIVALSNGHMNELKKRFNINQYIRTNIIPYAFLESDIKLKETFFDGNIFRIVVPKMFRYIKKEEEINYCNNLEQVLPNGFLVSGQEYLVKAIKELKEEGIQNLEVIFLGDGDFKEVKEYCNKYNLSSEVKFLGRVEQKEVFYQYANSDVMICPSILESWSNIQIEALYFNIPVIASNTAGTKDQIEIYNLKNLYVFDVADVEKLKKQIIKLMNQKSFDFSYDEKVLFEKLSIDHIGNKFINLYEEQ